MQLAGGAMVTALAGCGFLRKPPLTNHVPEASFLVGVDGNIGGDPESAELLATLTGDGAPPTDVFKAQTGLDFARVRELLLFGLSNPEALAPAEVDATVVAADFSEQEVLEGFRSATGQSFVAEAYKDRRLYVLRPGASETDAFAHLGDGTFVFGIRTGVEATLDVEIGDSKAVGDPLLGPYNDVREDLLVRFAIDVPERPPGDLPEGPVDPLEILVGGYYTPADGVGVVVKGHAVSEDAAMALEGEITTLLGNIASGGGPLAEALTNVLVERDGAIVTVTYEATVEEALSLIEAIVSGGGPSPAPVPGDDVTNRRTGRTFGSIQSAIDDPETVDGDVLMVSERPQGYQESIEVSKSLQIHGNPSATLDGQGSLGRGVSVTAPGAVLADLTVRNYGNEAIQLFSDDIRLENVTIEGAAYGLFAESISGVELRSVTVSDTEWMGIDMTGVTNVAMRDITAVNNAQFGLALGEASSVRVEGATLQSNAVGGLVRGTTDATLSGMGVTDNQLGGLHAIDSSGLTVSECQFANNLDGAGLFLSNLTDATFGDVTAVNNRWAGTLLTGSNVGFGGLTATDNEFGFDFVGASDVTVSESSIRDNGYGIYVGRDGTSPATVAVESNDIVGNTDFGLTLATAGESGGLRESLLREADLQRLSDVSSEALAPLTASILADYEERRVFEAVQQSAAVLPATGNWWGAASGPGGEGPGTGDAVFGDVAFEPWSTEPGPDWNTAGRS